MKNFNLFPIKTTITLLLTSAFLFLLVSCSDNSYKPTPPPEVTIAYPITQNVTSSVEKTAYTTAHMTTNLIARVEGYLLKVNYKLGRRANKGDTLFYIEPYQYQDNVMKANGALENAIAGLELAKATEERVIEASKSDAVSELDVLQAKAGKDQANAMVKESEAALKSAKLQLSYCYVTAPFDGKVSRNLIDIGNMVGASDTKILATIYQEKSLYVYFNLEDKVLLEGIKNRGDLSITRPEDIGQVYLKVNGEVDTTISAQVDYIDPSIDIETGTVVVRAILNNKEGKYVPGMYCDVEIPYRLIENALLVPESALSTDQSGRYLLKVDDSNKVVQVPVTVGDLINKKLRVVKEGITKDDKIIINGLQRARHGIKVETKQSTIEDFINN